MGIFLSIDYLNKHMLIIVMILNNKIMLNFSYSKLVMYMSMMMQ